MKSQFARLIWAAKTRTSNRKVMKLAGMPNRSGGWCARDLAAEAERKLGACTHIKAPEGFTILYGCSVTEAVDRAEVWAAQGKTANGKKYRKNQPCLAAGVFSCPRSDEQVWPALRDAFIADLKEQHGERLVSVIEHYDEPHPHIHYYLVPRIGEEFGVVHPGYLARKEAKAAAKTGQLKPPPTPEGKKKRGVGYAC